MIQFFNTVEYQAFFPTGFICFLSAKINKEVFSGFTLDLTDTALFISFTFE